MPINGMWVRGVRAWSSGDWVDRTVDLEFSPSYVVASTALAQIHGADSSDSGIVEYRHRLDDGSDEVVHLSDTPFMAPSALGADQVTGITWGLTVRNCWAKALISVFFWD